LQDQRAPLSLAQAMALRAGQDAGQLHSAQAARALGKQRDLLRGQLGGKNAITRWRCARSGIGISMAATLGLDNSPGLMARVIR